MNEIRFYYEEEPYGYFSNYYHSPFELKGLTWETVEHYYQAQKAAGTDYEETIRLALTPDDAKKLGNKEECPLRSDWTEAKIVAMREGIRAKYTQHADLRKKLVESGDAILIENSMNDYYWGIGTDGTGKSMLGKLLMELREELRNEEGN